MMAAMDILLRINLDLLGGDCYVGGCGGIKNPYVSSSLSSSWFGYAGEFPGGGGGGASSFSSSFRVDGGIGGNGQVIIEW